MVLLLGSLHFGTREKNYPKLNKTKISSFGLKLQEKITHLIPSAQKAVALIARLSCAILRLI